MGDRGMTARDVSDDDGYIQPGIVGDISDTEAPVNRGYYDNSNGVDFYYVYGVDGVDGGDDGISDGVDGVDYCNSDVDYGIYYDNADNFHEALMAIITPKSFMISTSPNLLFDMVLITPKGVGDDGDAKGVDEDGKRLCAYLDDDWQTPLSSIRKPKFDDRRS